jgi:predicted dehydrogenase
MTASSPLPEAPTDDASDARRIVVLGLGRRGIAYTMAAARTRGCTLAGLVDPGRGRREFARSAGFSVPSAPTLAACLALTPADTAVIATPPEARAAAIEEALGAGLAVLVDGLPAFDTAGAERLGPRIAAAGAPVGCVVGALFHPLFARASRVLGGDGIGKLREIRASVYVSRVFAAGSPPERGDVLEFAVAELLVLLDALFGRVQAVEASGNRLYGERLDEVHARLELPDGLTAIMDGSWSVPGYPQAALVIEALGEHGALLVSDDALEADLSVGCDVLPAGHSRRVFAEEQDSAEFETGDPGRALAAFVRGRARGGVPDALHPGPALRAARTLDALRASIANRGGRCEVGA